METISLVVYCIIAGVVGFAIGMIIERIVLEYKYRKLVNKRKRK